jgi:hypothetical protein
MKTRKTKNRLPPFLALHNEMLDAPATKALSHGAFRLYATLRRKFNPGISERWNGRIYLSQRDAQQEIGSNREEIAKWYRELQHYGFIAMMTPGCLGVEGKGKAPHWRLTELDCKCTGVMVPATKDFLRWNGEIFRDQKKQNPGPEKAATGGPEKAATGGRKRQPPNARSGPEKAAIRNAGSGPEKAAILSLPYPSSIDCEPDATGVVRLRQRVEVEEDDTEAITKRSKR